LFGIKPTKPAIPTTLDEAIAHFEKYLSEASHSAIISAKDMAQFHFTDGRRIRNEWGLWTGGPLAQWFEKRGIWHADDMSGIILDALQHKLRNQPFDLDAAIQYYKDYWAKTLKD
jgi:hypothetical protein